MFDYFGVMYAVDVGGWMMGSVMGVVFFFKQKTAYEMRISDWSSDVCSSDLFWNDAVFFDEGNYLLAPRHCIDGLAIRSSPNGLWSSISFAAALRLPASLASPCCARAWSDKLRRMDRIVPACIRSEEHKSELQSLMRLSYAVLCLKNKPH